MSFGRRKGCSKASTVWPACPPWWCLMRESQVMGTPSTSNLGDHMRDGWCTWATGGSSRLSTELDLLLLWSWDFLYCLFLFGGPISPSSGASCCLFLLSLGLGFSPRSVRSWEGGFTRGLDLFASWREGTLYLAFMSSLKLWLGFGAISFVSLFEESSRKLL